MHKQWCFYQGIKNSAKMFQNLQRYYKYKNKIICKDIHKTAHVKCHTSIIPYIIQSYIAFSFIFLLSQYFFQLSSPNKTYQTDVIKCTNYFCRHGASELAWGLGAMKVTNVEEQG